MGQQVVSHYVGNHDPGSQRLWQQLHVDPHSVQLQGGYAVTDGVRGPSRNSWATGGAALKLEHTGW
jgi:hypothetical protein